jgi:hypothetical protein
MIKQEQINFQEEYEYDYESEEEIINEYKHNKKLKQKSQEEIDIEEENLKQIKFLHKVYTLTKDLNNLEDDFKIKNKISYV